MVQKGLKKEALIFLMIVHLTEKRSPPLIKVKKNESYPIGFKIASNGSRVVV